jgi:hypothetical protein
MPFHSSSDLDAAFDTVGGFAWSSTVTPVSGSVYTAPAIIEKDVEFIDEDSGIRNRVTLLEFRKSDLADSEAGLSQGDRAQVGTRTYIIQSLEKETTYTMKYFVT